MACWNKTKVHVAGVPLSSVAADCRLVGPFGCDGVSVYGKAQLVLLPLALRANEKCLSHVIRWLLVSNIVEAR